MIHMRSKRESDLCHVTPVKLSTRSCGTGLKPRLDLTNLLYKTYLEQHFYKWKFSFFFSMIKRVSITNDSSSLREFSQHSSLPTMPFFGLSDQFWFVLAFLPPLFFGRPGAKTILAPRNFTRSVRKRPTAAALTTLLLLKVPSLSPLCTLYFCPVKDKK